MSLKQALAAAAAAALVCAAAGGASAATLIGAKTIHITNHLNDYLQVAEVVANSSGVDVAASSNGGSASGEADWQSAHGGVSTAPSNAIDGNTDGIYVDGSIYHSVDGNGFLDITLAAPSDLSSLLIYGRTDCCKARDVYDVTVFNGGGTQIYSRTLDATSSSPVNAVPEPATWALMMLGVVGVGATLRSRRKLALAAA